MINVIPKGCSQQTIFGEILDLLDLYLGVEPAQVLYRVCGSIKFQVTYPPCRCVVGVTP